MKKLLCMLIVIISTYNIYGITGKIVPYTQNENTKFLGIKQVEENVLGFNTESSGKSFEERLDILEKKIVGKVSDDNILVRQRKLYDLIFLDGSYYSLMTKTDNLEDYLFQNRRKDKDLLTRVEKIEEYLLGERLDTESVISRINNIYEYLLLEDSNFANKAQFLQKDVDLIEIKAVKEYGTLQEGEILEFNLEKDIKGIAKAGSIVVGQVISKEAGGVFKDEKVVIVLRKIINEDRREIAIYKKLEIVGNTSRLLFGKYVRIDNVLIIG